MSHIWKISQGFRGSQKVRKFGLGILSILILINLSFSDETIWNKFSIELIAGISTINPTDLNLQPDRNTKLDRFYNDDYFEYRALQDSNFSYTKTTSNDIPTIKNALLLGLRLKFEITEKFSISLGIKRLSREHNREVSNVWTFPYNYGDYQFRTVYDPYILSVRGYIPSIGIFFQTPLNERLLAGGFLEAGPLFGKCFFAYDYTEEWYSNEGDLIHRTSNEYLEENGEGTGFALEAGLRISITMGKFAPFFEGSYAYQKIEDLSGPGTERIAFLEETWEGEWGIKQYTLSSDWGDLTYEYPSNYWGAAALNKHHDFNLDLSGFQFRLGISYRF
jgi:hypothetical protein